MTPKHSRNMYRKQRTLSKHNILPFLSSALTKVIFNVRVRTANFEMTCIRLGLCLCIRSMYLLKFFLNIYCILNDKWAWHKMVQQL